MKSLILKLIRLYQAVPRSKTCRFIPSCSEYCYQAVGKYGIVRGSILSLLRISRCHPFSRGGHDPLK
jgi:hypothetical protein